MIDPRDSLSTDSARDARVWWFASLLLLASAINYMDRQTLANAAVRISREFEMTQEQYGNLYRHIDETHSFDQGLALAGCLPFVAFLLLAIAWPRNKKHH